MIFIIYHYNCDRFNLLNRWNQDLLRIISSYLRKTILGDFYTNSPFILLLSHNINNLRKKLQTVNYKGNNIENGVSLKAV